MSNTTAKQLAQLFLGWRASASQASKTTPIHRPKTVSIVTAEALGDCHEFSAVPECGRDEIAWTIGIRKSDFRLV